VNLGDYNAQFVDLNFVNPDKLEGLDDVVITLKGPNADVADLRVITYSIGGALEVLRGENGKVTLPDTYKNCLAGTRYVVMATGVGFAKEDYEVIVEIEDEFFVGSFTGTVTFTYMGGEYNRSEYAYFFKEGGVNPCKMDVFLYEESGQYLVTLELDDFTTSPYTAIYKPGGRPGSPTTWQAWSQTSSLTRLPNGEVLLEGTFLICIRNIDASACPFDTTVIDYNLTFVQDGKNVTATGTVEAVQFGYNSMTDAWSQDTSKLFSYTAIMELSLKKDVDP
jgi:hypothetical protein